MPSDSIPSRHPLDVIAAAPPAIPEATAIALVRDRWDLRVEIKPLVSERDQNFRLTAADGRRYVLKIANATEDPQVTDFQIQALLYVEARADRNLAVPRILRTPAGDTAVTVAVDGVSHRARIVSFVDGRPLGTTPPGGRLCREMGGFLARLGLALDGFEHPGAGQSLLWDMKQALCLRDITGHIPDEALRMLVETTLDEFERQALPRFGALRWQVIHNDMNPDNVLVREDDGLHVAGMIDFGDMVRSPLVVDIAVAGAYLRAPDGDPLRFIGAFLGGYREVRRLEDEELVVLHTLVKTRLATTVTILHWRAAARHGEDAYLAAASTAESGAADFLRRLADIPAAAAAAHYRVAGGS
ncbi:MAG: phosphotransferase [Gammaproteobacteria bacterium]|nr:phosphotransferase [Gammaproteobacteria bacterium]MDH5309259.1 phosphotransferase [Gammaproteobacteria bacterium]